MNRPFTPVLPLAICCALLAAAACSRSSGSAQADSLRVIPPALAAPPSVDPAAGARSEPATPAPDSTPSPEEVKEFEKPVRK